MTRRLLIPAAAIVLGVVGMVVWQSSRGKPVTHHRVGGFAESLLHRNDFDWEVEPFAQGHLHFLPSSHASKTAGQLGAIVDSARRQVLRFIEMNDSVQPIELFFVDTREEMRQLVGRPIGGMVSSGERTAIFVYNAGYNPFLLHELTHLYTHHAWGQPRHRWITEGLAMLASGSCQGHTVDEIAHGFEKQGKLVFWPEFPNEFDRMDEVRANVQAASMVNYLMSRWGMEIVREVWTAEDWSGIEDTYQTSVIELEARWLQRIRAAKPAILDVERLRKEGC